MKNKHKPEKDRPEFPLDELFLYTDEKGESVFESTDFFTYSERACDHCKKKVEILHLSQFLDRISFDDGRVFMGKLKRISILCDDCWGDLMETIDKFMRERKYPPIKIKQPV